MRQTLLVLLLVLSASFLYGEDQGSKPSITDQAAQIKPTPIVDNSQTNMKSFFPNTERNFVHIFSRRNYDAFLFAAVGTAIASTADDEIHDYFQANNPGQAPEKIFGTIGKPYVLAPAIGSLLLIGQHKGSGRFHDFSYALAQAYALDYAIVSSIKYSVGRERPDQSNSQSFPSGHATDAFMIASIVHNFYGTKAGIFGYTFATLMATSRLKIDKHWFSDVVTGAALGYIVGTSVCSRMNLNHNQYQLAMVPLVDPFQHRAGLNIYLKF